MKPFSLSQSIAHLLFLFSTTALIIGCTVTEPMANTTAKPPSPLPPLQCNDSIKQHFKPDELTTVVMVKAFIKGDKIALAGDAGGPTARASEDVCMVKLNVGPGNPGPEGAPSTAAGIGIEIWLPTPENWNERIHAMGGGGWQGGSAGSSENIASPQAAGIAMGEGAVSSTTDTGHASIPKNYGIPESDGDFAMLPDGSINDALWEDFVVRAIHQQALKTKALTTVYYGKPARYSYWDGSSTGGRQGHKLAQEHPEDFDGIVANMPALHWTNLLTAMSYAHIVYQNDLDGQALSVKQLDLASTAAIAACDMVGGEHLGYLLDPGACHYDPSKDTNVLCSADGGSNNSDTCLTPKQAQAINKIWYGPTVDGSVPDPSVDNGWQRPPQDKHLWYGLARGTSLWNAFFTRLLRYPAGIANPEKPTFLGTDQIALSSQDASMASSNFKNESTDKRDGWKNLSYAELAKIFEQGKVLNAKRFSQINTNKPDLSEFEAKGGKLLAWHGNNDEVIPVQGTTQYYDSVVKHMGDLERVQNFYRVYIVPGNGHHSPNGTANLKANPPMFKPDQIYKALVNWVENGVTPGRIDLESPRPPKMTQPVCPYPQKASYVSGDPKVASSFTCS